MSTRALSLGVAAGLLGAAVWAAIVYFFQLEIGWLAWGVGLLVGVAVLFGNEGHKTKTAGLLAAIIAALSVVVGKYAAVKAFVADTDSVLAETVEKLDADDEFAVSYIADEVAADMEMNGQTLDWPGDTLPMEPTAQMHYPANVWAVAQARWDSMGPGGQEEYKAQVVNNLQENIALFQDMVVMESFKGSFGGMDLLFFGLAIVTAFQIAGGKTEELATEPATSSDQTPDNP